MAAAGLSLAGFPLQITSAVTFSLCLGLAVDDTIHVLVRYRQNQQPQGSDFDHARSVERTIGQIGHALAITTAILVSGFAAMLVNPMPGVQLFAVLSCFTLMAALIGDLVILPALLMLFGRD
ncbi:MAG: MMPL family transporter [Planctomycetota bacterium]